MSRVLNAPIQYFYDEAVIADGAAAGPPGIEETASETYFADFLTSRESVELNKAFARIEDARTRRAILDLVRSLAQPDGASDARR